MAAPGLNKAIAAKISSNVDGFKLRKKFLIPLDSNWNIPQVFAVLNISSVSLSSNGILAKSISFPYNFLISFKILSIKVRFFNTKKSIFKRPNSSKYSIE